MHTFLLVIAAHTIARYGQSHYGIQCTTSSSTTSFKCSSRHVGYCEKCAHFTTDIPPVLVAPVADPAILQQLVDFGFPEARARKALLLNRYVVAVSVGSAEGIA